MSKKHNRGCIIQQKQAQNR